MFLVLTKRLNFREDGSEITIGNRKIKYVSSVIQSIISITIKIIHI